MKKKVFIILIFVIIFIGVILGVTDYKRVKSGEMPIFMIRITDGGKVIHEYIGLGYRMQRSVGISYKEELYQDNYVKFGLWFYLKEIKINKPKIQYAYTIETDETNLCDDVELYYESNEFNIYTYCLNSIIINDGTNKTELSNIIKDNPNIIEEIINSLVPKDMLYDGGTTVYKDSENNEFTNNGLTLIKCNTVDGNRDIYIGPISMEYESNYCKENMSIIEENNNTNLE